MADRNSLRVSNDVLTNQLRQVLRAGSNITFDTSNLDFTLINGSGGYPTQISNPQELDVVVLNSTGEMVNAPWTSILESATSSTLSVSKVGNKIRLTLVPHAQIYNSSTTYPASQPLAFVDVNGLPYATQANGDFFSNKLGMRATGMLAIDEAVLSSGSNIARIPLNMGRNTGSSSITLVPESASVPTLGNLALVNGVQKRAASFSGASTLAMSTAQHDANAALNFAWDCTVVYCGTIVPNTDTSSKYFEFTGNSAIYPFSLANTPVARSLVLTCGDVHTIPYMSSGGVYVFRISQATSFTSYLDVFFNGTNIYSSPFSNTATAKSLGLGGILRLGDAANTSSSQVVNHLSWYDYALSDAECFEISQYIAVTLGLSSLNIRSDAAFLADAVVSYASATNSSASSWAPTAASPVAYIFSQSSPSLRPTFTGGYASYNFLFSSAQSFLDSGAINGALGKNFSVAFMFAPGGIGNAINRIMSFTMSNSDLLDIVGSYDGTTLTIGLAQGASQRTMSFAHVAGTNDELALVFNCKLGSHASLAATRFDAGVVGASCSLAYAVPNVNLDKITIGRTTTPTTVFPYNIGDIRIYARNLPAIDSKSLVSTFTSAYNLPMTSTQLLTPR